jgi:hypothetical protein
MLRGHCPICGMATGDRDPFRSPALPDADVGGVMLHRHGVPVIGLSAPSHECALSAGRRPRQRAE